VFIKLAKRLKRKWKSLIDKPKHNVPPNGLITWLNQAYPNFDTSNSATLSKLRDALGVYLHDWGALESFQQERPCLNGGEPVPWFTYPAIAYIEALNLEDSYILEFGSGHSTLFWAERVKQILSIETNKEWFDEIGMKLERRSVSHVSLEHHDTSEQYLFSLKQDPVRQFDVIIVDAIDRFKTLEGTIDMLSDAGFVILDNSDWYPGCCEFMREKGFIQIDFSGLGPHNRYAWTTSFFFRAGTRIEHRGGMKHRGMREYRKPDDCEGSISRA
jgi:hypothetical protein